MPRCRVNRRNRGWLGQNNPNTVGSSPPYSLSNSTVYSFASLSETIISRKLNWNYPNPTHMICQSFCDPSGQQPVTSQQHVWTLCMKILCTFTPISITMCLLSAWIFLMSLINNIMQLSFMGSKYQWMQTCREYFWLLFLMHWTNP